MNTYLITYDLRRPRKSYQPLHEAIKSYKTYWHHLDSTWIVCTNKTAVEIKKHLKSYLDSNDKLLVMKTGEEVALTRSLKKGQKWLEKYL